MLFHLHWGPGLAYMGRIKHIFLELICMKLYGPKSLSAIPCECWQLESPEAFMAALLFVVPDGKGDVLYIDMEYCLRAVLTVISVKDLAHLAVRRLQITKLPTPYLGVLCASLSSQLG